MKVNLAETQDLLVFYLVLLCIHVGHLGAYFALIGLIPALKNFLCIFIKVFTYKGKVTCSWNLYNLKELKINIFVKLTSATLFMRDIF